MKFSRIIKVSFLAIIAIGLVACSATPTRRSFKETWKDSVVSTKIKMKLTSDKIVKKRNIDVDTWRGVVTLTGRVTSMEEKERAEQLVWMANGVRGVDNFLKLVDDSYAYPQSETIAGGETEIKVTDEIKATDNKTMEKEKIVIKETVSHPVKSRANTRVTGPVEYDETVKEKQKIAKRTRYTKPDSSGIIEEDLTAEESLAIEAAEELKKLRGEETE